jgi:hypothetical protein
MIIIGLFLMYSLYNGIKSDILWNTLFFSEFTFIGTHFIGSQHIYQYKGQSLIN